MPTFLSLAIFETRVISYLVIYFVSLMGMWQYPTSINLRYIFKQNAVFPYSFLLSFVDFIKVGISNKP
ncbi:hypothetical protein COE20_14040 [Bacillus cereus]|nr:hypothetical protein CON05_04615 [Bacillus cereus]PFE49685.1 hypothetical protein CN317_04775 [Bacillus cereus]PFN12127.1 hypothetical protein COJ72_28255 [Bacillus cereus]PFS82178.1 hypothetical protein COK56_08680 [Bacillus cereus]PGY27901.1 hypothetical protein COE20_14040 [Bacillus cereus]